MELKQIEHLAELSKLEFTEKELAEFSKEFESLVNFADTIKNADITGKTNFDIIDMKDLRSDEIKPSVSAEELLQNAPMQQKGCFVVPRIME